MKIIIINGSPRENGLTATLLHTIEKYLQMQKAEVSYYDLGNLTLSQCKGCCTCYKTGRCFIDGDAEMLSEKIGIQQCACSIRQYRSHLYKNRGPALS